MLCNTERWGNNPKCWNTIASSFLRIRSNSLSVTLEISLPLMITSPEVGFINRLMQRSKVDFPLPESPIITNISPSRIDRFASFTATVHPVAFNISLLLFSSFNMRKACCLSLPKMRYKSLIVILLIHNRV